MTKITLGEGVQLVESLQPCAQVRSYAPSDENTRCKSSSGQRMVEARTVAGLASDQCEEQQGGYSGSTK